MPDNNNHIIEAISKIIEQWQTKAYGKGKVPTSRTYTNKVLAYEILTEVIEKHYEPKNKRS